MLCRLAVGLYKFCRTLSGKLIRYTLCAFPERCVVCDSPREGAEYGWFRLMLRCPNYWDDPHKLYAQLLTWRRDEEKRISDELRIAGERADDHLRRLQYDYDIRFSEIKRKIRWSR